MESRATLLTLATLGLLAGCATGPGDTGRVTIQLVGTSGGALAAPAFAGTTDDLTITSVQIVARKIKLERAEGTCPVDSTATAAPATSPGEAESESEDGDDCPAVRLDPMLLEPPVDSTAEAVLSVDLPEGTYEEMKLQIHKPSDNQADAVFLAGHPEFDGLSIRVTGTFNGDDFTFESAITAVVEIELETPVVVDASTPTAMTLAIDVASWFAGPGGTVLDPNAPTQQIRSQIEQNIRKSFHAFEDHDHDGHPD